MVNVTALLHTIGKTAWYTLPLVLGICVIYLFSSDARHDAQISALNSDTHQKSGTVNSADVKCGCSGLTVADVLADPTFLEFYNKGLDTPQVFYASSDISVTLGDDIFSTGASGGMSYGNTVHPALVIKGDILIEGGILMTTERSDVKIWRRGGFLSIPGALGMGEPDLITDLIAPEEGEDTGIDWMQGMCTTSVVGQSCPLRHNWGVDSCIQVTNASLLCYCGGGYRSEISGVVLRHFMCDHAVGNNAACLQHFRDTSPACCSPTSHAQQCADDAPSETVCRISLDPHACCDGLTERQCVPYGCVWEAGACAYDPEIMVQDYKYVDINTRCESFHGGSVCDSASRSQYLAIYADIADCSTVYSAEQCLLSARQEVNNHVWDNNTLSSIYNWFNNREYHLLLGPTLWRDCEFPALALVAERGLLRNAHPAKWRCETTFTASRIYFVQSGFDYNYMVEQGRRGYIMTHFNGAQYCLSTYLTAEQNITYNAASHPREHPLWVATLDTSEWPMCAIVELPVEASVVSTFTYPNSPLGFDFVTKGLRYANAYAISIKPV
jgi:hypothetical protein